MKQSQLGHFTVKPSNAIAAIVGQTLTHNALQSWDRPSHTMHCNHGTDPHTQCTAIMGQTLTHNALQSWDRPSHTMHCNQSGHLTVKPSNAVLQSWNSLRLDPQTMHFYHRTLYCWTLTCFMLQSGSVQFTVIKHHAAVTV